MRIKYDSESDAAYIFLKEVKPGAVERTKKVSEGMLVDFGKNNVILGIEVLGASKRLAKKELELAQKAHA